MLRRNDSAHFIEEGFVRRRYYFSPDSSGRNLHKLSRRKYHRIAHKSESEPVVVIESEDRKVWLYQERFFTDTDLLTVDEVSAVLRDREKKQQRHIDRVMTATQLDQPIELPRRSSIADDVKVFVWQRDQGRCISCGSNKSLEYDHIIPLALGGSNSARNLQLLCEDCNRTKGGNVV